MNRYKEQAKVNRAEAALASLRDDLTKERALMKTIVAAANAAGLTNEDCLEYIETYKAGVAAMELAHRHTAAAETLCQWLQRRHTRAAWEDFAEYMQNAWGDIGYTRAFILKFMGR